MKIDKKHTASFDVDPQKGFTPLCPNELPVNEGQLIGKALNENATYSSIRVVSKDSHPHNAEWIATENKPMLTEIENPSENMDVYWNSHCVVGTEGFELIPDLPKESDYDFIVYKGVEKNMHPYGACYHDLNEKISTGVIEFLKCNGIENVIVGGLATDYCVALTAKQLKKAGFNVIINLNSCRGISEEQIEKALYEFKEMSITVVNDLKEITLV